MCGLFDQKQRALLSSRHIRGPLVVIDREGQSRSPDGDSWCLTQVEQAPDQFFSVLLVKVEHGIFS